VKPCPSCGYIVPGAWTECRRCGAALEFASSAPPAPMSSTSATLAALALAPPAPAPLPGEHRAPVAGPDTLLPATDPEPVIRLAPAPQRPRLSARNIAIVVVGIAIVVAAVYSVIPHGGHHAVAAPTILAPEAPSSGIPTSLSEIVRIAAESARHNALTAVAAAAGSNGAPLTVTQLAAAQPSYQWVLGDQPSTTNTIVSITSAPGLDVIAVSGTSRDVCAFGRWSTAAGAEYVTMAHVPSCSANAAPTTGWSTLAGGSNQDLPGENGF
jgi:hypothetical protein